jgi:sulfotransferase
MTNKKYFFLAGLPRSGNTLLSSVLNQNPDIQVSANSNISSIFHYLHSLHNDLNTKNFPDHNSLNNLIKSALDSYYKDWDAKYIIDRSPWGTPTNLQILKNYCPNKIKIIVTVRDIVEILSSFVRLDVKESLKNKLNQEICYGYRFSDTYKSDIELSCDLLMSPNEQIEKHLLSLHNLLKEDNKIYLHILEYKDLVNNPQESINEVYDFLEIPLYQKHNFNNISQFNINGIEYNDEVYIKNLHKLKSKITLPNYKVDDILPKNVIQKYSGLEFWK